MRHELATATAVLIASASVGFAATVTVFDPAPMPGFVASVTYNDDIVAAKRGTADDRANPTNAFGAADGKFFEIGLNDTVDFGFDPGFTSGGTVFEITFGNRAGFKEFAMIEVGRAGDASSFVATNPGTIDNQSGSATFSVAGGVFDTVRLRNAPGTKVRTCQSGEGSYECGGFDVDSINVSAVPLPAGLILFGTALAGLGALRRKKA